jgi:periplasmic protein TonB
MSYVSENKRANPVGLSAAIAFNGAVIVAIALSPMVVTQIQKAPPIKTFDVDRDPPPPDNPVQKYPDEAQKLPPIYAPTDPFARKPDKDDAVETTQTQTGPIETALNGNGDGDSGATGIREITDPIILPKPIFHAAVRDPKFARSFQPAYPPGKLQREIEGVVKLKILIGSDGRVRQVIILSATDSDFAAATERKALSSWRFTPATRDGVAVEDWQTLTVRFDIT